MQDGLHLPLPSLSSMWSPERGPQASSVLVAVGGRKESDRQVDAI